MRFFHVTITQSLSINCIVGLPDDWTEEMMRDAVHDEYPASVMSELVDNDVPGESKYELSGVKPAEKVDAKRGYLDLDSIIWHGEEEAEEEEVDEDFKYNFDEEDDSQALL